MEIGMPNATNGKINGTKENGFDLYPVGVHVNGEGLPYAPINWPEPGDKWSWRTGKRIAASGHHLDRYLYPPERLQSSKRKKYGLPSKHSVEQYLRSKFPNADVKEFFKSFVWKIPCTLSTTTKDENTDDNDDIPAIWKAKESSLTDSRDGYPACKVGNKACSSLLANDTTSEVMECDICCVERDFCRDCCCILCCQSISSAHSSYSYFRCTALVTDAICGHVAHIKCALKAYLAGTVGGCFALDAAYYCRRCDSRSDLIPHVSKLLQTCESLVSSEEIQEILGIGLCVLRGSQRTCAKQLLDKISSAMCKLKEGKDVDEVWKIETALAVRAGGQAYIDNGHLESTYFKNASESEGLLPSIISKSFDHQVDLSEQKNSQESEHKVAAETLISQKRRRFA